MNANEVWRRARSGERWVVRMQRRWWFAQLALWPTAIILAILASAAGWALWQRKSAANHYQPRHADSSTPIRVQG
jgi:hypothetical protein